jgi:hypothetical protein
LPFGSAPFGGPIRRLPPVGGGCRRSILFAFYSSVCDDVFEEKTVVAVADLLSRVPVNEALIMSGQLP